MSPEFFAFNSRSNWLSEGNYSTSRKLSAWPFSIVMLRIIYSRELWVENGALVAAVGSYYRFEVCDTQSCRSKPSKRDAAHEKREMESRGTPEQNPDRRSLSDGVKIIHEKQVTLRLLIICASVVLVSFSLSWAYVKVHAQHTFFDLAMTLLAPSGVVCLILGWYLRLAWKKLTSLESRLGPQNDIGNDDPEGDSHD